MAHVFRHIIRNIFLFLTILACIVYLLTLLVPFLNPQNWWLVGFLGLTFPYLFFLLVFIFFFWLIAKPKLSLLPLLVVALGYKQIGVTFAANFSPANLSKKPAKTFRIVSWNVANMYGLSNNEEIKKHNRMELAQSVLDLRPDIICLQEFNHSFTRGESADNIGLFSGKYPYYFYSEDYNKDHGFYTSGSIVFSKYPLVDSGKTGFPGKFSGSLIYVDAKVGNDTLRIFTTHLQSFGFNTADYAEMNKIKERDDEAIDASKNIFIKMKAAFTNRGLQAAIVRRQTDSVGYPSIICGDFNDVPTSYTYFRIRNTRQDAFLKTGTGVGKTYSTLAPMLRIDYILPDTNFTVKQFDMVDENLSDHVMLVSDLQLK
ncbi:endonuclease/exonuclease/phosphatase family protein [Parafilimonas sp.]|uniref:endonuclease/exonuclease/phosphatase family protein n=1 Tax=Parafilimonas sp. TaxID=1969739 RepID=UPI0039E4584C